MKEFVFSFAVWWDGAVYPPRQEKCKHQGESLSSASAEERKTEIEGGENRNRERQPERERERKHPLANVLLHLPSSTRLFNP